MTDEETAAQARLQETFTLHEHIYELVQATGGVAEASSALLAWLRRDPGGACRCCAEGEGHDPVMPCGQLQRRLVDLGAVLRQIVAAAGREGLQ